MARVWSTSILLSSLPTVNTGMVKLYASHHSGFVVMSRTWISSYVISEAQITAVPTHFEQGAQVDWTHLKCCT